jgi:prepilin-type N-terminal cleavage/methylation domain-containing protein
MRSRRGFTLLEIMIVVTVIAVLVAIAVPNFISARENSRRKTCISNLRLLDGAKEQWAMSTNAPEGAPATMSDLTTGGFLRGPASGPKCPSGGAYTLHSVGQNPTCSLSMNPDGHVLP